MLMWVSGPRSHTEKLDKRFADLYCRDSTKTRNGVNPPVPLNLVCPQRGTETEARWSAGTSHFKRLDNESPPLSLNLPLGNS